MNYRLAKTDGADIYCVWQGDTLVAHGGIALMTEVFNKKKGMTMNVTTKVKTIEERIEQYVKLRDHIKKLDDAHKESMAPFREGLEKLNAILLHHLNTIGVDSAKSGSGTVYKTNKESVSLEDPSAFMRHVIGTENWDLLERKANLTACKAFAEENVTMPPGVKFSSTAVVGVRRGK
jgi:hypothetical protein